MGCVTPPSLMTSCLLAEAVPKMVTSFTVLQSWVAAMPTPPANQRGYTKYRIFSFLKQTQKSTYAKCSRIAPHKPVSTANKNKTRVQIRKGQLGIRITVRPHYPKLIHMWEQWKLKDYVTGILILWFIKFKSWYTKFVRVGHLFAQNNCKVLCRATVPGQYIKLMLKR